MVEEAGGVVSDFVGDDNYFKSGNIIVSNLRLHKLMLDSIKPHLTDELKK